MGTESVRADVVIIGAGVSGLSAAYHLQKKEPNLHVIVLEAKERVGGRTVRHELKAAKGTDYWDLGGQWVGTCQPHVMGLIQELGLSVYPQYNEGKKVLQVGTSCKVSTYTSSIPRMNFAALINLHLLMSKMDSWQKTVPAANPDQCPEASLYDGMTVDEALRRHSWAVSTRDAFEAASRTMFGAEPSEMSMLFYLRYINAAGGIEPLIESNDKSAQGFKVKGGAGQIAPILAERVGNVWLGQPVSSIVQDDDKVVVSTAKGKTVTCSHVIMATPPHETVKINFEPMLPTERSHVLQNMTVGFMTKIIITYPTAFWREKGFSGEIVTNGGPATEKGTTSGPLCVCYDATTSNGNPALVTFIGGKQQREYNKLSPESRQRAVVESLKSLLGVEAGDFLEYCEKDWGREPYSDGGPVCVGKPGMTGGFAANLRLPWQRIHFAGTESATVWCGYINGAVQSGYRAANEVLYNIRPQCVAATDLEGTAYDPMLLKVMTEKPKGQGRTFFRTFFFVAGTVCLIGLVTWRYKTSMWLSVRDVIP